MEKILVLTGIKKEFDGYDRYRRENIKQIDIESKIKEKERIYDQIENLQIREATQEETLKYIEELSKIKEIFIQNTVELEKKIEEIDEKTMYAISHYQKISSRKMTQ